MKCEVCGMECGDDARFCPSCGFPLPKTETERRSLADEATGWRGTKEAISLSLVKGEGFQRLRLAI